MQRALRPYVTAGVAVVSASLIAATPVLAPGIGQRAAEVELSAYVPPDPITAYPDLVLNTFNDLSNLAGQVFAAGMVDPAATAVTSPPDPITAWLDVFTGAFNNVGQIVSDEIANPLPALTQLLMNQAGYAQTLYTGLSDVAKALVQQINALPAALQGVISDLLSGKISTAFANFWYNVVAGFIVGPGLALLESGLTNIPGEMAQNFANVVSALTGSPLTILGLLLAFLGPPVGSFISVGDTLQAALDAFNAGDPVAAITNLINIPANFTGALLNGYPSFDAAGLLSPLGFPGSPAGGPVSALLQFVPQQIATAIAPVADPSAAATVSAAAADISTAVSGLTAALDAGNLAALVNPADLAALVGPALTAVTDIPAMLMSLIP